MVPAQGLHALIEKVSPFFGGNSMPHLRLARRGDKNDDLMAAFCLHMTSFALESSSFSSLSARRRWE